MAHTTIIGIDVSKNFADACAISAQGEVMLETKIFYDTVGLQHFLKQLDQLAGEQRHCAVERHHPATGVSAMAFLAAGAAAGRAIAAKGRHQLSAAGAG